MNTPTTNVRFDLTVVEHRGAILINATGHDLVFLDEAGRDLLVPPSGIVIRAKRLLIPRGTVAGLPTYEQSYVPTQDAIRNIEVIYSNYPNAVLIGSIVSAQVYAGKVFSVIAASGYGSLPPEKRRYRLVFLDFSYNSAGNSNGALYTEILNALARWGSQCEVESSDDEDLF